MSFSSIMVDLDLDHLSEGPLRIAANMVECFDAHLIGITAGDIQPLYFMEGAAAQEMMEKDRASLASEMAAKERRFREMFKHRATKIEWRSNLDRPGDYVAGEARAADLIIVGSPGKRMDNLRQVDAGELVLRAGRPVLIVLAEIEWFKFNNIVVAWKDTREARRAVNDALPLLHKAKEVTVVELVERDSDRGATKSRVNDIAA